jgi:hypothetical protein
MFLTATVLYIIEQHVYWWIGKVLDESNYVLIEVLSWYFLGGSEENNKKIQSGHPVSAAEVQTEHALECKSRVSVLSGLNIYKHL